MNKFKGNRVNMSSLLMVLCRGIDRVCSWTVLCHSWFYLQQSYELGLFSFPWDFTAIVWITDAKCSVQKIQKETFLSPQEQRTSYYRRLLISSCPCLVGLFRWSRIYLNDEDFMLLHFLKKWLQLVILNMTSIDFIIRLQEHRVRTKFI